MVIKTSKSENLSKKTRIKYKRFTTLTSPKVYANYSNKGTMIIDHSGECEKNKGGVCDCFGQLVHRTVKNEHDEDVESKDSKNYGGLENIVKDYSDSKKTSSSVDLDNETSKVINLSDLKIDLSSLKPSTSDNINGITRELSQVKVDNLFSEPRVSIPKEPVILSNFSSTMSDPDRNRKSCCCMYLKNFFKIFKRKQGQ